MAILTHAKFHFNWLMLTLILASGTLSLPPPGPGERLKRPGLIGLIAFELINPLLCIYFPNFECNFKKNLKFTLPVSVAL